MSLSLGASSTGLRGNAGVATVTSASYSPPGNATLVLMASAILGSSSDIRITSVTNTGTAMAVAWAKQVTKGQTAGTNTDGVAGQAGEVAEIWTATTAASPGSITVSTTCTSGGGCVSGFVVASVTDSGGSAPSLGNHGSSSSGSGTPSAAVSGGCSAGSFVFAAVVDQASAGVGVYTGQTPAVQAVYDTNVGGFLSIHEFETTSTVSAGAVTMSMASPTTQNYNMAVLEITVPSGGGGTTVTPLFIPRRMPLGA